MIVLGMMSGTSLDGVDCVWTKAEGTSQVTMKLLKHKYVPFPNALRKALLKATIGKASSHEVGELHHALGRFYAKAASNSTYKAQLVGLHGQTIFHQGTKATLQIGESTYLAKVTQCPVVFNFRAADIASGGQGAPLAPVFHKFLLKPFSKNGAAFHNLGGISNITYFDAKNFIAFDTGPASILLDAWIEYKTRGKKKMDRNGVLAHQGLPDSAMLNKFLSHPFFKKPFPKSCGREEFNLDFIKKYGGTRFAKLNLKDQLATLTELTVQSIAEAYEMTPKTPKTIFFSGGGVYNTYLMKRLKINLPEVDVKTSADLGWPAETIEGGAFALLAYLRYKKIRVNLSTITGGKDGLHGQICEF
ncbi:MAG: anhydro-N-acetylmuramic acid kinase [Bdellovibrionales bacterium]|nr:anhydro-N-acetylmuramic acid kinase [Bdellovibrionales bacterium]